MPRNQTERERYLNLLEENRAAHRLPLGVVTCTRPGFHRCTATSAGFTLILTGAQSGG
jgi:hypothetical protein